MTNEEYLKRFKGGNIDYDSHWGYQCVDLVRHYLYKVKGYTRPGRFGNANENFVNATGFYNEDWEKVAVEQLREGDVIHSLQGQFGHVGIFQKFIGVGQVQVLEQNAGSGNGDGLGTNAIRLNTYTKGYFAGGWRKKATEEQSKGEIRSNILNDKAKLAFDNGFWNGLEQERPATRGEVAIMIQAVYEKLANK